MLTSPLTLGVLAAFAAAPLSIVPPMPFSRIVDRADLVVTATAVGTASRWEDGATTIRTHVRFEGLTVHKGVAPVGGALTLRFDGGAVGDTRIDVPQMPRPRVGRRYLMFVAGNGRHVSPIVGFHQGIFEIVRRAGREVLTTLDGLELGGVRDDRFVFVLPKPAPRPSRPMPSLGPIVSGLRAAHPDAARLERELTARAGRRTALPELPASRTAAGAPAAAGKAAAPPRVGAGELPSTEAAPILVPAARDDGTRATVRSLLLGAGSTSRDKR